MAGSWSGMVSPPARWQHGERVGVEMTEEIAGVTFIPGAQLSPTQPLAYFSFSTPIPPTRAGGPHVYGSASQPARLAAPTPANFQRSAVCSPPRRQGYGLHGRGAERVYCCCCCHCHPGPLWLKPDAPAPVPLDGTALCGAVCAAAAVAVVEERGRVVVVVVVDPRPESKSIQNNMATAAAAASAAPLPVLLLVSASGSGWTRERKKSQVNTLRVLPASGLRRGVLLTLLSATPRRPSPPNNGTAQLACACNKGGSAFGLKR